MFLLLALCCVCFRSILLDFRINFALYEIPLEQSFLCGSLYYAAKYLAAPLRSPFHTLESIISVELRVVQCVIVFGYFFFTFFFLLKWLYTVTFVFILVSLLSSREHAPTNCERHFAVYRLSYEWNFVNGIHTKFEKCANFYTFFGWLMSLRCHVCATCLQ